MPVNNLCRKCEENMGGNSPGTYSECNNQERIDTDKRSILELNFPKWMNGCTKI